MPSQPLLEAAQGDERRDDDEAAVAEAQLVVVPCASGGEDGLVGEALSVARDEPGTHIGHLELELTRVGLEATSFPVLHGRSVTRLWHATCRMANNGPTQTRGGAMSETDPQDDGAPAPILDEHAVHEVAPGVHVISDRRIPLVPNVGIALGDGEALVVDTGMGPRNGTRVLAATRRLARDARLTLTTTHFHPEHAFGAQVFVGEARYVANRAQVEELRAKGEAYIELFTTFGPAVAAELEGVELVEAGETYDGALDVDVGGVPVQLREWGLAHTGGDQVVFLPEHGVLFTGDLVETRLFPIFPFFPPDDVDVDGSKWIDVLGRIEALAPEIVVPGHGEVAGSELIGEVRAYLEHVRDETQRTLDEGRDAEEAVAELEPAIRARWASWDAPEWIGFAIRSFHSTLSG